METRINAAKRAAQRFFRLAEMASRHGGFWVSPCGGTARVVAGVIASRHGIPVEEARRLLDEAGQDWGGVDWYTTLRNLQPCQWDGPGIYGPWEEWENMPGRWDVRVIAVAACRGK